jgi:hypothetical protein
MTRAAAVSLAAAIAMRASSASAVEREHQLGADLGTSVLVIGGRGADLGPGVGGHWSYGLSDAFNVVVEGAGSIERFSRHPTWIANADAGLSYVFDVLQWVPYASLLVGGYTLGGRDAGGPKFLPGAEVALGLDYRLSRDVAAGVTFHEHLLTEPSTYPSFIQVFARIECTWGW